MNAEKQLQEVPSHVNGIQERTNALQMEDNRPVAAMQAKMIESIQRQSEDEDDLLQGKLTIQRISEDEEELSQGKFVTQREVEDEDDLIQGKFIPVQRQENNLTGMPDSVKQRMEKSFHTDFSSIRVHPESSSAPEVGALAYTQGTDIHFAPGQFKPDTSSGQQLLGHELAHVVQQQEGRVQPTTEISGMAVNDDISLEHEADMLGNKAANS
ncbi:eCIS core domain-containing protein [Parabacteroides pacaensis]|uniref:eCIS core domain-containing protein n=1 Tax=Parabacteroides pacaensis TaxID=2086575 RepID=UPI000D100189|nr:DUF4157 domain-containing protein [Parabacteroides pacaensis]